MKFWWKGEPIIYGSNRFNVINNDLLQDIKSCLAQYKAHTTIEDMVRIAHEKNLKVTFEIKPSL